MLLPEFSYHHTPDTRAHPCDWSLCEFILKRELVPQEQLDIAIRLQQQSQGPLAMILWQLGFIGLGELGQLWDFSQDACEGCA